MIVLVRLTMVTALLMALSQLCQAHKPSDSYLRIDARGDVLRMEWDIAIKDLDYLIGLDANQNGEVTWGELKEQRKALIACALSHLQVDVMGRECPLEIEDIRVNRHSDGCYAALMLATGHVGSVSQMSVQYSLLFDADPTHRGLVFFDSGNVATTQILSPNSPTITIETGRLSIWRAFLDYVKEGLWHIWIGYDHILFLVSLLLPAVLVRDDNHWYSVGAFRPAWLSVLKVVTMFTLAHSITLWLAVMGYVLIPAWIVESAIALSIVVTAMNNLFPVLPLSSWGIAFVFGLVHGFGFANVLADLGLEQWTLATALLGFNVGVELGQLAIVLMVFPLAYLLRNTKVYLWLVFRSGSVAVACVAAIWMVERMFNAEIIGF